ncbi:sensor histidine kinase [Roseovarius sp.]|jgi:signal transduction histidine kinase
MCVWVAGLLAVLFALNLGQIRDIPGAVMVQQVMLCDGSTCASGEMVDLPFFAPIRFDLQPETLHMRVTLQQTTSPDGLNALYFPKLSDNADVWVDGQLLHPNTLPRRLWNTPLLVPVPGPLVETGQVEITLALRGMQPEGLDLQPFFYGPKNLIAPHQAVRAFFGPGLARFGLGLMGILAVALLVIWVFRRQEREYLWLGLACATALITLVHFGYGFTPTGYRLWTVMLVLSASLYVLFILKFLYLFVGISLPGLETAHAVALLVFGVGVMFFPPEYAFALSMWGNVAITVPSAFLILVVIWVYRARMTRLDFAIFFPCLSIAMVLGIYELRMSMTNAPLRTMHLFHFMPLVMSMACKWLILSRLIHSLRDYEDLTASLNNRIIEKSAELEASFAELADIRQREAIAAERGRIMLDLHDGIGGQLVSTLSYMRRNDVGDDKCRLALEDALRDLALMLDSMENHDSLVTLLGMLRTRLEGLLSENGIEFDWQVQGEPRPRNTGPSQALNLSRIVQEAITNVIKHAQADTITIYVDESRIRISDNGVGFVADDRGIAENPSHGLANMKRRSQSLGARFSISSSSKGTDVMLDFA